VGRDIAADAKRQFCEAVVGYGQLRSHRAEIKCTTGLVPRGRREMQHNSLLLSLVALRAPALAMLRGRGPGVRCSNVSYFRGSEGGL
jgi:hypothetical protein